MAYTNGEWIPMRLDLYDDPAILQMAEALDCRPELIVGYCHRFWCWVSRNSIDGKFGKFSPTVLGSVLGLNGFPELLIEAGWLAYDESTKSFRIPNYDRWLGETAKKRLMAKDRQRKHRRDKCHAKRVTSAQQKRDVSRGASFEREISKDISLRGGTAHASGRSAAVARPPDVESCRYRLVKAGVAAARDWDDDRVLAEYSKTNGGGNAS